VYVDDPLFRPALESKALFFVAHAPARCLAAGLSAADLALAYSIQSRDQGHPILAGRSIHTKVLNGMPVSYGRAVGFINVTRELLAGRNHQPLDTGDIVACVFRLKDPDTVATALGVDIPTIARACHLRPRIVESALARYRLPLVFALPIWRYLRGLQADGRGQENPTVAERLTDDPREFIKTDKRSPIAIKPGDGEDEYVYSLADVSPAPRTGHPWALDAPPTVSSPSA
jgi:hypothetical protein